VRVLVDITNLGRGGAERQVVQLLTGLTRRGHDCVLAVNKSVEAYEVELRAGGVAVESFGRQHRYDARILPDLVAFSRRFEPDVILAVAFTATLWGRLAAVILRCPCVTAEHSSEDKHARRVILVNKLLGGHTRATVACGRAQIPSLVAAGNRRRSIVVINNGVDTAEYFPDADGGAEFRDSLGIPADAVVVGLVAAHRPEKRHDRFIRLIEGLSALGLDVWGCMVGGGPLLDVDRRLARSSPVADRLVVTGPLTDLRAVYSGLDLVVLVSDSETFPLSFLEAQACARPVVGMDAGAVRETFAPGASGVLVDQGDDRQMIREVAELVADRDRLRSMGEYARAWVEANLSVERMVTQYERLLHDVAGGVLAYPAGPRLPRRG
jgi:glycosyltransferase involved in cell wall biosynthesis